jgi:hypothetical protein
MKRINVPNRLMAALIVSVAVAALTAAGFAVVQWRAVRTSDALTVALADNLIRSYSMLEKVNVLRGTIQHALRLRDPDELEKAVETVATARKEAEGLVEAAGPAAVGVKTKLAAVAATERAVMETVLRGDGAAASELFLETASPQYESTQNEIRVYQEASRADAMAAMARNGASVRSTVLALIGIVLATVTALCVFQWRTRSAITGELRRVASSLWNASTSLSAAANQVAGTSQSVSQGATTQAAALEQTSAALEEMSSMTRQNTQHAESAKALAGEARAAADRGDGDMQALGAAMDEIAEASANIAKIVKSIDEIAFQTNILALNAAVEAARAGEAGMGFAVVADEVRSLAQRAAQAARETSGRIEDSIAKSQRGIELRDKVVEGLRAIVTRAREVDGLVSGIAGASQQQRQGIEQITAGMNDMEKTTQSGAAGAEESAAAAEELSGLAMSVQELVVDLRRMVTSAAEEARTSPGVVRAEAPEAARRMAA